MHAYGLDTQLPLVRILDVLGLGDALWACRTLPVADLPRLVEFARRCAARVEHLGGTAAEVAQAAALAAANTTDAAIRAVGAACAAATADAAVRAVGAAAAAAEAAQAAASPTAYDARAAAWHAERAAQIEIFREIFG
jgi:hypothetical protein